MQLRPIFLTFVALTITSLTYANLSIYKAGSTLITGAWAAQPPSTINSISANTPFEGAEHYKFDYTTTSTWAGFGLNMDNWGNSAAKDFSGYSHFRLAYRGVGAGHTMRIKLRNGNNFSNPVDIGGNSAAYTVVDIPMAALVNVNNLLATAIREINIEVLSVASSESGTAYVDAIELVNIAPPSPIANATCLARAASMGKGFNTSNWLEAWWRISSGTYPDPADYTRAKFLALKQAGFSHVRLPVIFEKISNPNAPYTLNTNHLAFQLVDSAIVWANAFNLKLIIDNHHGYDLTDANFASEKARKCAVWRQLVQRYGNLNPNQFFFEIYNEPNGISNTNWRTIAQSIMDTVRAINTTHTFIIGGNGWNSMNGLSSFQPLTDPNVIYTFHTYEPYFFTHQGMSWTSPTYFPARAFPLGNEKNEIRALFTTTKSWANLYGVPIYMGEFGVGSTADATSRCNWIDFMTHVSDSLSIPWAYWDAKNYNDAFGFYPNGISQANVIPCFSTAMGLYNVTMATNEVLNVNAICNQKSIDIQWLSEIMIQPGLYQIEGSSDGKTWEVVQEAKARLGENRYTKRVEIKNGQRYFRVVYLMLDGRTEKSAIITANCVAQHSLAVFPNPINNGDLTITYDFGKSKDITMRLINSSGQLIQHADYQSSIAENRIKVSTDNLPKGLYFIQLWSEDNEMISTTFVVN
jgi:endoglucanase